MPISRCLAVLTTAVATATVSSLLVSAGVRLATWVVLVSVPCARMLLAYATAATVMVT